MRLTEIDIKPARERFDRDERCLAYISITLDGGFAIRDLKIIQTLDGLLVAMPSRKLMDRCPSCDAKNHLKARFCNHCGHRLADDRARRDEDGWAKLHADVAHPISQECREWLVSQVLAAYREKMAGSGVERVDPAEVRAA